jgi:hypothetical protein
VTQIDRVVEAVETTLSGSRVVLLAKKALPALDLPKVGDRGGGEAGEGGRGRGGGEARRRGGRGGEGHV